MKSLLLTITVLLTTALCAQNQKIVADGTVTFSIQMLDEAGNPQTDAPSATKVLYIKGLLVRADIVAPNFLQSTITDNHTHTAVILREIGSNKYMTVLNAEQWKKRHERYEGMKVQLLNDTKNIAGQSCKKAVATLKDGSSFVMYYAPAIDASADENPYQFRHVPGFVLEYEAQTENGRRVRFTATALSLDPVPASRFEIPKTGYRLLNE